MFFETAVHHYHHDLVVWGNADKSARVALEETLWNVGTVGVSFGGFACVFWEGRSHLAYSVFQQ